MNRRMVSKHPLLKVGIGIGGALWLLLCMVAFHGARNNDEAQPVSFTQGSPRHSGPETLSRDRDAGIGEVGSGDVDESVAQQNGSDALENEGMLPDSHSVDGSDGESPNPVLDPRNELADRIRDAMDLSPGAATEVVVKALSDEDESIRQKALEIAVYEGILPEREQIERLLLTDPSEVVRVEAYKALVSMDGHAGGDASELIGWGKEQPDPLIGDLAWDLDEGFQSSLENSKPDDEKDPGLAADPRNALPKLLRDATEVSLDLAQEILATALKEGSEETRQRALEAALYEGIPPDSGQLRNLLLTDPSESVRVEAFRALVSVSAQSGGDVGPLLGWGKEQTASLIGDLAVGLDEGFQTSIQTSMSASE